MSSKIDAVLADYLAHAVKLKGFVPRVVLFSNKRREFVLWYLGRKKLPASTVEDVEWVVSDFGGISNAGDLPGLSGHFWEVLGEPIYLSYLINAKNLRVSTAQKEWLTAYNYAISLYDGDPSAIPRRVHDLLGDYPRR